MDILNNDSGKCVEEKPVICHPQGNEITLRTRLREKHVTVEDGNTKTNDEECVPNSGVIVRFSMGKRVIERAATVQGNIITVTDDGSMPSGTYSIEILFEDSVGRPMRYKKKTVFHVVDDTACGGQYDTSEFDVEVHYPILEDRAPAIIITDDTVIIREGGFFQAEDNGECVRLCAEYGASYLELTENNAIINIRDNHE